MVLVDNAVMLNLMNVFLNTDATSSRVFQKRLQLFFHVCWCQNVTLVQDRLSYKCKCWFLPAIAASIYDNVYKNAETLRTYYWWMKENRIIFSYSLDHSTNKKEMGWLYLYLAAIFHIQKCQHSSLFLPWEIIWR